jgi:hypothetical protein
MGRVLVNPPATEETYGTWYAGRLKFFAWQKYWPRHFLRIFEALPDELES